MRLISCYRNVHKIYFFRVELYHIFHYALKYIHFYIHFYHQVYYYNILLNSNEHSQCKKGHRKDLEHSFVEKGLAFHYDDYCLNN